MLDILVVRYQCHSGPKDGAFFCPEFDQIVLCAKRVLFLY